MSKAKKISFSTILSILAIVLVIPFVFMLTGCGAKLNVKEVSTQEALIEAIADEKVDEIKLTSDIIIEDTIVVTRKVTLNLNGKTISNTKDIWVDTETEDKWSLISVGANGDLTITGNGKLKAKENDCYAVDVMDGAKCTINNGTFVGNIHAVYVNEGSLTVNGGKYSIQQTYNVAGKEYEFVLNCYDQNREEEKASIVVYGGEFAMFNPANCAAEGANTNFVAEGYKAVLVEGSTTDYKVVKE